MQIGQEKLRLARRWPNALPLLLPACAGLVYLGVGGAPLSFIAVNAAALCASLALIAFLRMPSARTSRLGIAVALVGVLVVPLVVGPDVDGIARWVSLGGFSLHAGLLGVPLLVRIAASEIRLGPWIMLAATLAAFAQPDFATCFALSLGALAIAIATRSGGMSAVFALGLFASLGASFTPNLAPQPFVETVLPQVWSTSPIAAFALACSLAAGAFALLRITVIPLAQRWGIAATIGGFVAAAVIGAYPYPLIGYGAASILGLAAALLPPAASRECKPAAEDRFLASL